MEKTCAQCGATFGKTYRQSRSEWEQRRFCSRACAYASRKGTRVREAHPSWKGGRHIHESGYVRVRQGDRYVMEHRLVMEQELGRALREDETVHHLNGDRTDNRLSNLQLRTGRHGRGVVLCCAECGSRNLRALDV